MQAAEPRSDLVRLSLAIEALGRARAEVNRAVQAMDGAPEEQQFRPAWFETNKAWHAVDAACCFLEELRGR